jgi:predicted small metal-binding protein
MRIISEAQRRQLEDLSEAGLLSGLPLELAEKDIHVTDLLRSLATLRVEHAHFQKTRKDLTGVDVDDGITMVFAGGTCLSKAYGAIRRMSEDIDIKIILTAPSRLLAKEITDRARLKALHQAIEAVLAELGFEVPEQVNGAANPFTRDNSRYCIINSKYKGHGAESHLSLRAELKLELIQRAPKLEPQMLSFGYLHERLASLPLSNPVSMLCIQPSETLAEKVLSLLRRCAWNWGGFQHAELDPTLVRHVYDVHQITKMDPSTLEVAQSIFQALVTTDVTEFQGQNPEFDLSPATVLRDTLGKARTSDVLTRQYSLRVLPLIYGPHEVTYQEAFSTFETVAHTLLRTL